VKHAPELVVALAVALLFAYVALEVVQSRDFWRDRAVACWVR
jgi:hypothetical protein